MSNTKIILDKTKESYIHAGSTSSDYIDGLVFSNEYTRDEVIKGLAQFLFWADIDIEFDVIKSINGWKVVALAS